MLYIQLRICGLGNVQYRLPLFVSAMAGLTDPEKQLLQNFGLSLLANVPALVAEAVVWGMPSLSIVLLLSSHLKHCQAYTVSHSLLRSIG